VSDIRGTIFLSAGFWVPYLYGHWIIVKTQDLASDLPWLNYPGFLFIPLLVLLILSLKNFEAPQKGFDWVVAGLSSANLACIFFLLLTSTWSPLILAACFTLAAFGQVYIFLRWWGRFLETTVEKVLQAFLVGLVMTSLLKMLMSVLVDHFIVLVVALPLMSALMIRAVPAGKTVVVRKHLSFKALKSLWRLGVAIVVFLLLWGFLDAVTTIFAGHYGYSSELSFLAQGINIGFACFLLWYVFIRKGTLEYNRLWSYLYACLAFALVMFAFFGTSQIVQVFTGASFQIAHMLILIAVVDLSQRSFFPPYILFIVSEMAYSVTDWSTGFLIAANNIYSLSSEVVAILFFVAIAALAFFLPQRVPAATGILFDLNRYIPLAEEQGKIESSCNALANQYDLTKRELEIMQLLCQGRSKPYIAETMYLSENTVKSYTKNLYKKLSLHSKQELISFVLSETE